MTGPFFVVYVFKAVNRIRKLQDVLDRYGQ